jgi:hypothetical protein
MVFDADRPDVLLWLSTRTTGFTSALRPMENLRVDSSGVEQVFDPRASIWAMSFASDGALYVAGDARSSRQPDGTGDVLCKPETSRASLGRRAG